ncbi:hypothetical protein ETD83_38875, partial [Actinomadura soli]
MSGGQGGTSPGGAGRDHERRDQRVEASGAGALAVGGNIVNSSTLPLRTTMFVGRDGELAELDAALVDP